MDTLVWDSDYSVGHQLIDEQHKELFRRINVFGNALWDGLGKKQLEQHLRFLADYVIFHFRAEEELMLKNGFPDLEMHKSVHDDLIRRVSAVLEKVDKEGLDSPTAIEIFNLSCDWTRGHVRGLDQKLGKFLFK